MSWTDTETDRRRDFPIAHALRCAPKKHKPQTLSLRPRKAVYSSLNTERYNNVNLINYLEQRHRATKTFYCSETLFTTTWHNPAQNLVLNSNPSHYLSKYADLCSAANTGFGRAEGAFSCVDWSRELAGAAHLVAGTARAFTYSNID